MMICAAAFSPADGSCGQVVVECVAQFNPAVSIRFKPFTPPSWLNLLDSFLILLSTSAAVTAHWLSWQRFPTGDADRISRLGHDRRAGVVRRRQPAVLIGDLGAIGAVSDGDGAAADADR